MLQQQHLAELAYQVELVHILQLAVDLVAVDQPAELELLDNRDLLVVQVAAVSDYLPVLPAELELLDLEVLVDWA
jgi:hypothetical protein